SSSSSERASTVSPGSWSNSSDSGASVEAVTSGSAGPGGYEGEMCGISSSAESGAAGSGAAASSSSDNDATSGAGWSTVSSRCGCSSRASSARGLHSSSTAQYTTNATS